MKQAELVLHQLLGFDVDVQGWTGADSDSNRVVNDDRYDVEDRQHRQSEQEQDVDEDGLRRPILAGAVRVEVWSVEWRKRRHIPGAVAALPPEASCSRIRRLVLYFHPDLDILSILTHLRHNRPLLALSLPWLFHHRLIVSKLLALFQLGQAVIALVDTERLFRTQWSGGHLPF